MSGVNDHKDETHLELRRVWAVQNTVNFCSEGIDIERHLLAFSLVPYARIPQIDRYHTSGAMSETGSLFITPSC